MSSSLDIAVSKPAGHPIVTSEAGRDDILTRRRPEAHLVGPRNEHELAAEWDKVAAGRDSLIEEGRDLSYLHVLLPGLREMSTQWLCPGSRILDVGCGTGKFAAGLAEDYSKTTIFAIDPSRSSIQIAKEKRPDLANLIFECSSVESFAEKQPESFDLVVANMLFQNVASLDAALKACTELLVPGGALVFAVPHPCFWPRYWKYDKEPWFRYDRELWIEAPFKTSLSPDAVVTTTHTHRPLSRYINALCAVGLCIEELVEPYPDAGMEGAYPLAWEFPRFLIGRCVSGNQDFPQ